jgi:hypothetical protein
MASGIYASMAAAAALAVSAGPAAAGGTLSLSPEAISSAPQRADPKLDQLAGGFVGNDQKIYGVLSNQVGISKVGQPVQFVSITDGKPTVYAAKVTYCNDVRGGAADCELDTGAGKFTLDRSGAHLQGGPAGNVSMRFRNDPGPFQDAGLSIKGQRLESQASLDATTAQQLSDRRAEVANYDSAIAAKQTAATAALPQLSSNAVAPDPRLPQISATFTNGNNIYGVLTGPQGLQPGAPAQLVVANVGGGKPQFFPATNVDFDPSGGGTINTGAGAIVSTGGMSPKTTITPPGGSPLELSSKNSPTVSGNLAQILNSNRPAASFKP